MEKHVCKACGGYVDAEGYAMGGEVEGRTGEFYMPEDGDSSRMGSNKGEGWELEERQTEEGMRTEQQDGTEIMRKGAFADAVRRRFRR